MRVQDNDAFATAAPVDGVTLRQLNQCVMKTPIVPGVLSPKFESSAWMVGGVCFDNHLRVCVKNSSKYFG
jgi:hypothetical protein